MATNPITNAKLPAKMTPLWVISLFVFLTEAILVVAATQMTGNHQTALVSFVIIFPFLVAGMFFVMLWYKKENLYAPSEYPNLEVLEAFRGGSISTVKKTEDVQGDVEIVGDPDRLKLLFKADGGTWVRSTKAMDVGPGCVVQMSTKFLTPQGTWNAAEALTYVPDTVIVGEEEGDGHYLIHKHQQTEDGDA